MHLVVLAFIGVLEAHNLLCDEVSLLLHLRIARSRTVWVTVIFKARLRLRRGSCSITSASLPEYSNALFNLRLLLVLTLIPSQRS